ncbi:OLC1v1032895C1 [Oldenlandia corymbosa var. corymbosa]|uniref:OLC1v1032895C1 n=1 Tax=Oldenlandia corymbosa var. corymbosa TaxID=529605 RepID=A0AAV1CMQ3_OLDCO|nr:OLC1v1032895C1 [Oldenlandia corymbosa var. corymbosa]
MAYWQHVEGLVQHSSKYFRTKKIGLVHLRFLSIKSPEMSPQEELSPTEWYEKAYLKLKKLSGLLKGIDLIDGRLFSVSDNSRVFDDKLEVKMLAFKLLSREFIGCPTVQEAIRKNGVARFGDGLPIFFGKPCERGPLTLNSLTRVANILNVSAQQRKLVRLKILPQVTEHKIWTGALEEILNDLRTEIDYQIKKHPSKETKMAQQVVASCLKHINIAISYDLESTSWMRLAPSKGAKADSRNHKWEEVLEMFVDLINCLSDRKEYVSHVTKLEIMKEGLYQIRDVLMDKNIGYKETRHHENLVQKKLIKTLGHSSRCLYSLLLYYLYGSVRDIEVEVSGGFYPAEGKNVFYLCMGKFLTSDEETVILGAMKQLDRALGLFKFVWETAEMKGELKVQGHLWCIGAEIRFLTYKGNPFLLHGIH